MAHLSGSFSNAIPQKAHLSGSFATECDAASRGWGAPMMRALSSAKVSTWTRWPPCWNPMACMYVPAPPNALFAYIVTIPIRCVLVPLHYFSIERSTVSAYGNVFSFVSAQRNWPRSQVVNSNVRVAHSHYGCLNL